MSNQITLTALQDLPLVKYGDDLCSQITDSLARESLALRDGDIIVVAQKIISKAEGRTVDLNTVIPGKRALELAKETQKDARVVELILGESKSIIRKKIYLRRRKIFLPSAGWTSELGSEQAAKRPA